MKMCAFLLAVAAVGFPLLAGSLVPDDGDRVRMHGVEWIEPPVRDVTRPFDTRLPGVDVTRLEVSGDETRYIGRYIMINDTVDRLQTPYGYLRDGVYHAYVFDYQGNVMAVVAGDDVVQTNLYYADGLPMNTSIGTTANAFKYTSKELSLYRGLPVYDFTARHTLPAGGNLFRTMDPLAEKYHGISPYAFCAGDPINFSDPTGQDIEAIIDDIKYKYCRLDDGVYAFIDANGNQYAGGNDFGDKLVEALNNIQDGAVGKALVYSLVGASNTLTLEEAPNSASNMTYHSANKGESADVRVEWNPYKTTGGYSHTKDGGLTRERPAFIGLTHELGHAFDVMILKNRGAEDWYTKGVKRSEIIAGDIENAIRHEHNIAPRLFHGFSEKQGKYNTSHINYYLTFVTCILGASSSN